MTNGRHVFLFDFKHLYITMGHLRMWRFDRTINAFRFKSWPKTNKLISNLPYRTVIPCSLSIFYIERESARMNVTAVLSLD